MDLPCPICGEPWDFDTLHEEAELRLGKDDGYLQQRASDPEAASKTYSRVYEEIASSFRSRGCVALREFRGTTDPCAPASERADTTAMLASAAYDLLGDDMDGAAAMIEDWEMGC